MGSWSIGGNLLGNAQGLLGTEDNSPLVIETNGNPRLTVDTSGNLGVGTSAPSSQLHVNVAASPNPISALTIDVQSFENEPNAQASYFLLVHDIGAAPPNGLTHLAIRGDGNVGIGTESPAFPLDVNGDIGVNGVDAIRRDANNAYIFPFGTNTTRNNVVIGGGPGGNTSLQVSGNAWVNGNVALALDAPGQFGPAVTLTNTGGGANTTVAIDFYTFDPGEGAGPMHDTTPTAEIAAIDMGNFANDIVFRGNQPGGANQALQERMRITSTGNIVVPGDILLTGADCAEQFDVSSPEPPDPGTVVVIDDGGALRESCHAYDKKVAGVVSGAGDYRHGVLLDQGSGSEHRVPVALMGKVYCKVDAQYAPVEVGDLLTTSATPGHAMKATEAARAFGSVIGKALLPLAGGKGLIPILIALQ
ncbi:MAG: hypothetical protein JO097_00310 [Acidobacteriaceae bacterium]|nr:hypothetical protein [Acidobacteriaceae bacterium]MBV9765401.1 hypothetical protein [Acidobacteriaceae bacterium]